MKVKETLQKLLERKATSRTKRYFLKDFTSDSSSNNAAKLCDVVKTLNALRNNIGTSNYIASRGGGEWNVHDYEVPNFLNVYINSGKIYFSEVYYRRRAPLITFKNEECETEGSVLTPTEFNEVWNHYNENQYDLKLTLEHVEENPIYLMDIAAFCVKDQSEMRLIGNGPITKELAIFCGLESDMNEDNLSQLISNLSTTYAPSEDEVIDTLFSTSLNGGKQHEGYNADA